MKSLITTAQKLNQTQISKLSQHSREIDALRTLAQRVYDNFEVTVDIADKIFSQLELNILYHILNVYVVENRSIYTLSEVGAN